MMACRDSNLAWRTIEQTIAVCELPGQMAANAAASVPASCFDLKGLNVTIAAQWRVSPPPKHAPVVERPWIRPQQNHWCASPVLRVARKYAWREPSIILLWSRRLAWEGWALFIRRGICNWIASWR